MYHLPADNSHEISSLIHFLEQGQILKCILQNIGGSSTLYLLVSSAGKADSLCKQFGPGSGQTECQTRSESKLFDTLMVFLKEVFKKVDFEKNQQTT